MKSPTIAIAAMFCVALTASAQGPIQRHHLPASMSGRQPVTNSTLPQRTFVSAQRGLDANVSSNCSIANPCRSFTAALTVTEPGGEIIALDTGGYGPVTVDRAVSIIATAGVYAAITASTGSAVTVNAAGERVVLRGLTLNGLGAQYGVNITDASLVVLESTKIAQFQYGFFISTATRFHISDSTFIGNGTGIYAYGSAAGEVAHSKFIETSTYAAIDATEGAFVSVVDSLAYDGYIGFLAETGGVLNCTRCTLTSNAFGLGAQSTDAKLRLNDSVVSKNATGLFAYYAGTVETMANSMVRGNTTDVDTATGTVTTIAAR